MQNNTNEAAPAAPTEPAVTPQPVASEPPQTPAPAAPGATPQPELPAEIQQRLQAAELAEKRVADLERISQQHQSRADQAMAQLRAVTGAIPQQDPIAPYLKRYADRGYTGDDAKFFAEKDYEMDQRFNQLQSTQTASLSIPSVLQQVYSKNPQLFSNERVMGAVETGLRSAIAQGQAHLVTPEYAFGLAAISFAENMNPTQPNGYPPTAAPLPQFGSQFGPVTGYQSQPVAQPSANVVPPHIKAMADAEKAAVAQRFGFQPKPAA